MRTVRAAVVSAATVIAALGTCGAAAATVSLPTGYGVHVFATGGSALSGPDDITRLGDEIFVAFQNASTATGGGGDSTIVAYRSGGTPAGRWNISGHVDGLTADPARHVVIASTNEDANSRLYTIDPRHKRVKRYTYAPDPATLSGGGTDAISIVEGHILISASNPSPTVPGGSTFAGPAVYQVDLPPHGSVAKLTPTFFDNSIATDAVSGQTVTLNLSDPDSNAVVPAASPRFGGDFVLDSQGDSELVFDKTGALTRLSLTTSGGQPPQVDDVRWSDAPNGTLFVVDAAGNAIYAVTGPFSGGVAFTSIPSGSPSLVGDVGTIDLSTGAVSAFATGFSSPKGLLYVSGRAVGGRGHDRGRTQHRGARRHQR